MQGLLVNVVFLRGGRRAAWGAVLPRPHPLAEYSKVPGPPPAPTLWDHGSRAQIMLAGCCATQFWKPDCGERGMPVSPTLFSFSSRSPQPSPPLNQWKGRHPTHQLLVVQSAGGQGRGDAGFSGLDQGLGQGDRPGSHRGRFTPMGLSSQAESTAMVWGHQPRIEATATIRKQVTAVGAGPAKNWKVTEALG